MIRHMPHARRAPIKIVGVPSRGKVSRIKVWAGRQLSDKAMDTGFTGKSSRKVRRTVRTSGNVQVFVKKGLRTTRMKEGDEFVLRKDRFQFSGPGSGKGLVDTPGDRTPVQIRRYDSNGRLIRKTTYGKKGRVDIVYDPPGRFIGRKAKKEK